MPSLSNSHIRGRFGLVIALVIAIAVLAMLRPHFLSSANLLNVVRQISINGMLAVGVTFVLLTAGVDLSLGSVVALAGVLAAHFAHPGDYSLMVPVSIGILAGVACGAINGTRKRDVRMRKRISQSPVYNM